MNRTEWCRCYLMMRLPAAIAAKAAGVADSTATAELRRLRASGVLGDAGVDKAVRRECARLAKRAAKTLGKTSVSVKRPTFS